MNITRSRVAVFISSLTAVLLLLTVQCARYMLMRGNETKELNTLTERGAILDRNGRFLAVGTTVYNLSVNKNLVSDPRTAAHVLAQVLDLSEQDIEEKFRTARAHFFYLKKKMSETEKNLVAHALKEHSLKGFRLEAVRNRIYPESSLASTVIGYVGDDGRGLSGIEYTLQDVLSPAPYHTGYTGKGHTVTLSIDRTIQYMMEKIADTTLRRTQAEGLMFLAVEAKTGQILSYVSKPSANLSHFSQSTPAERFDRPALFIYEPGSVFKIFSIAALLELGVTYTHDTLHCDGSFSFTSPFLKPGQKGHLIRCLRPHGTISAEDIIRLSCNDGMAQIAERADNHSFEQLLRAFGFGAKTEIELPGETVGLFSPSERWSHRSKHTIAIGQEIGVSALQVVAAATALANEGVPLGLSLLHEVTTAEGTVVYRHKKKPKTRVISAVNAQKVLRYMRTAAELGTGKKALVDGVPIAVKTGTAQMAHRNGRGYSDTDYLASCIGLFPAHDPEIILYIAIIRPIGQAYGELIAAPVISQAANEIIDYRGMVRANAPLIQHSGLIHTSERTPPRLGTHMPDLTGQPKRLLLDIAKRTDVHLVLTGEGYVYEQHPPAGTPLTKGMTIELKIK